jgi:serine protease Do
MAPLDREMREKYRLASDVQGVVITDVDPDSPAAEKNLQPGDVILEVQNEAVRTPDDVTRRVDAGAKAGRKAVLLLVSRDGQANYVGVSLGDAG